jgi:hypothetical protein
MIRQSSHPPLSRPEMMKIIHLLVSMCWLVFNADSLLLSKWAERKHLLTVTNVPRGTSQDITDPEVLAEVSVYFDIEIAGTEVGRLIFHVASPSPLPLHSANFIELVKGSRRGIDPKAHYVGCEFDFSPTSIEDGMGRYRWGHQVRGRGRNAIGRADQPISDPENQLRYTHSCFGGQYYGIKYDPAGTLAEDPGVLLTVPVAGPGYGSSKFSVVRVGESPIEWRERLLVNCGVIGRMDPSCLGVLHTMARQRIGPPTIVASGEL